MSIETTAVSFPSYGLENIQVPGRCPRCKSTLLDCKLDVSKSPAVSVWAQYKLNPGGGCIHLVLTLVTLGLWLIPFGLWSLAAIPAREAQKRDAIAAAPQCVRLHCRACLLDWYAPETEYIASQPR